ncbi:hypothetical protein T492DRAFT_585602, partial [Pavlovales sp. CCMP2436]
MAEAAEAAAEAAASGVYITWRCVDRQSAARHGGGASDECARVARASRCLCGCTLGEHAPIVARNPRAPKCGCRCYGFEFVPSRPEELGMWWLPRRAGFDVRTWRAPCKCKHGHDAHDPQTRRCRAPGCGCGAFASDYACINCECGQEAHETVFETTAERDAVGRPTGERFKPLADSPFLQQAV